MSVDFFPCANCGYSICDCGEYYWCDCGYKFCSKECAKVNYDEDENPINCIFCRGEDATAYQLLEFLLKKMKLTRQQALQKYKKDFKAAKCNTKKSKH